jgi:hypothetical protein
MATYGQLIVGHPRASHLECPTQILGLVTVVQAPVQNWTDTRFHCFYPDVQGKTRRTSSYNWRVDMGTALKPRKESNKTTLARVRKEMAQPRIVKAARKGASTRKDSQ